MTIGFTGTQRGMTEAQQTTFCELILSIPIDILGHGDCMGADEQAHNLCVTVNVRVHVHPPIDPSKRAWCTGYTWIEPPAEYLVRNRNIVVHGIDGLIAVPKTSYEVQRSGTWATVRYARSLHRPIWIIWPDGKVKVWPDGKVKGS